MHELGHNLGLGHGDGGTIANVAGYKGFWYNPDAWMTVNFRMHRIKYIYLCELLDPPEKDKRQYYIEDQLYWTDFDDIYDELPEGKSGGE